MRIIKTIIVTLILIVGAFSFSNSSLASSKYISNVACDVKQKVAGKTFVAKQYEENGKYKYKLLMTTNGRTKVLAKDVNCDYVTNGKVLYYTVPGETRNTIFKMDIKTGKKKKIVNGRFYAVKACNGKYLYYGIDEEADGIDLYVMNIKTKKKKHMVPCVGSVICVGKYVATSTNTGAAGNYPVYLFKENGSGKKKIVDGFLIKADKNKIIYGIFNEKNWKQKVYSYNPKNGAKKAVTGWVKTLPAKYRYW